MKATAASRVSQETTPRQIHGYSEPDVFAAGVRELLALEIRAARSTLKTAMLSEAKGYEHGAMWVRKVEKQLITHTHRLAEMLGWTDRPAV